MASPRSLSPWSEARPGTLGNRHAAAALRRPQARWPGAAQPLLARVASLMGATFLGWFGRPAGREQGGLRARPLAGARPPLLVDAFSPLCHDAVARMQACGLTMVWSVGEQVAALRLPATTTLGLVRVAHEALDQVLRQADRPGEVRLELDRLHGETGAHLRLAVIDVGRIPAPRQSGASGLRPGQRLPTLQREATQLGAQVEIGTDAEGWRVELVLPLALTRASRTLA